MKEYIKIDIAPRRIELTKGTQGFTLGKTNTGMSFTAKAEMVQEYQKKRR